ncbi:MAG TPA: hypothetical protein VEH53_01430 [archaeon]|nr:hypothetical protein [archaeon]
MKIDRYTKVVLTVIAITLIIIALKPLSDPKPSYAARAIEYKLGLFPQPPSVSWERSFNEFGEQGWELVAIQPGPPGGMGTLAIFKR